jgi:arginyl-tRNA synthetase
MIREVLQGHIEKAVRSLGLDVGVVLEFPGDLEHGDYATNVALAGAKSAGTNPRVLAEKIVGALDSIDGVERVEIAGPGFINFHLSRSVFTRSVAEILVAGEKWGRNDHVNGYKVMVEFSQPNQFKPFHIGHLMSTAVGESVSRFIEFSGAHVFRATYGGDVGLHVAKCLWGLKDINGDPKSIEDLGRAYVRGATAYEDTKEAREEIDDLNKKIYAGTSGLEAEYREGSKTSIKHLEEIYTVLGTEFDRSYWETEVVKDGRWSRKVYKKEFLRKATGPLSIKGRRLGCIRAYLERS